MKFYTGDVKNPDMLHCRVCMTDLDRRTMVESERPIHFGTCPKCGTRWQYDYGRMEKCESQSHQFDVDEISTWHLADPEHCTHHDHKARETGEEFYPHYFYFPFYLKQNVWNPMQPQCKLCGISIREIILEVLPRLREDRAGQWRKALLAAAKLHETDVTKILTPAGLSLYLEIVANDPERLQKLIEDSDD